jgi:pentatricopeptide repeat protein
MPYCILIDGLVKGGKIEEAKVLFNEMKGKGVKSGMVYSCVTN